MPFTFSHPAIVLPLAYLPKKLFSLTGLVIGSLTPDFEYFFRMQIESEHSHTLGGLFLFDLPLGILLAFVFHLIIRNQLFNNLPFSLKSRLIGFKSLDWLNYFKSNWLVVIFSVFIGVASHLLWDSFTHDDGFFVKEFPVLKNTINFLGFHIPILKILQHSSTLIGGIVIVYAIFKLPKTKHISREINLNYWIIFAGLMISLVIIRVLFGLDIKQFGNFIVTAISAGLISLVLTSLFLKKSEH